MTQETLIQSNFSGGEISPRLYGRTDIDRYYTSTSELRNMIVGRAGNLLRRPGTTYLGNAFGAGNFNFTEGQDAKLFAWQRDVDDGYVLAYSGNDITLFSEGAQLTNVPDNATQTGAPTKVLFTDANTGFESSRPDLATFASVADVGYFAPYPEAEGVHRLYTVKRLVTATNDETLYTDRTDTQGVSFPAQSVVFTDGPYERFNTREDARVHFRTSKGNGDNDLDEHPLDGHGTHSGTFGNDVGDFGWVVFTSEELAAVQEYVNENLGSHNTGDVYPYTDRLICIEQVNPDTEKIERGVGRIFTYPTRLTSLTSGSYDWYGIGVQVVKPFVDQSTTFASNATAVDSFAVSVPFHEGFNTFTFHQDRLYFSIKTKPNRVYATTTAGYSVPRPDLNFVMTDKPDGSLTSNGFGVECSPSDPLDVLNVRDTDGLDFGLTAGDLGDITEMVSDARGLLAFTENEAFLVSGGGALAAITPTNVIAARQSNFGVQLGTDAVQADKSVLFIQDGGLVLRETGYEFNSDRYLSRNLSFLAEHLMKYQADVGQKSNIRELVLQRSPETRFLMRRGDGKAVNLSFQPDEGLLAFSLTEFGVAASTTLFDAGLEDNPPFSSQIVSQTVLREDDKERLYQLIRRRKQSVVRSGTSQLELDFEVVITDLDFGLDKPINQLFLDSKTVFDNRLNVTKVEMSDASNARLQLTFTADPNITTPTAGTIVVCRNLDSVRSGVPSKFANTRYSVVSVTANTMIVELERGGSFDETEFSLPATEIQGTVGAIQTTLTGLTRFEDCSVSVCAGEQLVGSFSVSSGQIDMREDTDQNPVRTEQLLTDIVTVGLPYSSRVRTVPVATLRRGTAMMDMRSDQTRIYKLFLRLVDTFGGSAGGSRRTPLLYRRNTDFTNAPFQFSGLIEHSVLNSSELGTTVQVQTDDPYNFEMTALHMQVDKGGVS